MEDNEIEMKENGVVNIKDPFLLHFSKNMSKTKGEEIKDISRWKASFTTWPILGRIAVYTPTIDLVKPRLKLLLEEEEDTDLPTIGIIPHPPTKACKSLSESSLQKKVIKKVNTKKFSALQSEILTIISQYIDFHYPCATHEKWDKIRTVYSLHCLSHLLKTRKQVTNHNNKLNNLRSQNKDSEVVFQDIGFTRPKVLILVPFKHTAYKVIKKMMFLLDTEVKNKSRFEKDFGPPTEGVKKRKLDRPKDFDKTFEGDINEDFKIGLTVTKKSLKLYSEFFKSDIIVASPLGLRYSLEIAESNQKAFLSSIEVLIMDQADVFLMQNWEHLLVIRDELNKVPKNLQDVITDLYRIRRWCVDGLSHLYRQTIIFASTFIDYDKAFLKKTRNFAGKMEVANLIPSGSLCDVTVKAELILLKVKSDPCVMASCPDAQFRHFTQHVLPLLRRKKQAHTLVYVPDYCDYVRLVSYFKEDGGSSVATINEYMVEENNKVAKVRSLFFDGKKDFLIYTERFHFYRRYKIKGVRHVVFYQLPTYSHFFPEICNMMADEYQNPKIEMTWDSNSILVPFQVYDVTKLVGVLGSYKAQEILASDKSAHKCQVGDEK